MKKLGLTRITLVGMALTIIAGFILLQMARIQSSQSYQQVSKWADEQFSYMKEVVSPTRGYIYDRWGRLLAGNEDVFEVGVLLQYVANPKTIAQTMGGIGNLTYEVALDAASIKADEKTAIYAVLADFLPAGAIDALDNIKQEYEKDNPLGENPDLPSLRGLVWYSHLIRSYPENSVAANVLGFYAFKDRDKGRGYYGVEEYYNDILGGGRQEVLVPRNPYQLESLPEVPAGASLVLTIDREVQAMVEKKLDEAVKQWEAASGTVIILDPRNGEVLAMATQPRINLNQYWDFEKQFTDSTPFNRAVSQTYEPGSVFKVLTMAAALDAGAVKPDTEFNDGGSFKYGGSVIYNWDRRGWGKQTMQGCMQHSLNVCLAWVATELGKEKFYQYMLSFGVGQRTNIDLGGEKVMPLKTPNDGDWYPINLATNSFGQGVAVTPIQMAVAASAIANGGKMMKPHVLKAVIDNSEQYNSTPQVLGVPISEKTAVILNEMLANSLEKEASLALVPGYRIAGKTGTAEIPEKGVYGTDLTNASFVGWGPVDDPRFLVYVWIEKPKNSPWGSVVAAPLFRDIVKELVVSLDLPPDATRLGIELAKGN